MKMRIQHNLAELAALVVPDEEHEALLWDIVSAVRGPDCGDRRARELKKKYTLPIREWARWGPSPPKAPEDWERLISELAAEPVGQPCEFYESHYVLHVRRALEAILWVEQGRT